VNLLDENIVESQRQRLVSWRIRVRQIGRDIARAGIKDPEIVPLLHQIGGVTFFTRDSGFYRRDLCHSRYSLVVLEIGQYEVASMVRRFLRHPEFNTRAKRLGRVTRVSPSGIRAWRLHSSIEHAFGWRS
jgi:hypothetical protein